MFRLTIDLTPATTTGSHPDREAARAELLRFLAATAHAHRVTEADWAHTSYDIFEHPDHQMPLGRAFIDEICACQHTHHEHDEIGCTVADLESGGLRDCECRGYEPISTDPCLFDIDDLLTASGPT